MVYLCANVGSQGLLVVRLPAPFVPHSASLSPAKATRVLSVPVPVSAPPTGLDECLFFISLVLFDFLSVLVVQGGTVCLSMPPSWFSLLPILKRGRKKMSLVILAKDWVFISPKIDKLNPNS